MEWPCASSLANSKFIRKRKARGVFLFAHAVSGVDSGVEGGLALGQLGGAEAVHGLVEPGVKVVDPELVEVAEHDVGRAVGDEVEPIVEDLLLVFGELDPARLHLDEHAPRPDEVGVLGAGPSWRSSRREEALTSFGVPGSNEPPYVGGYAIGRGRGRSALRL